MYEPQKKGKLITIEGIDGCGKSSAARVLANALREHTDVVLTKEPGATELGKCMRKLLHERTVPMCPQAEFFLFSADRAQHVHELVLPALAAGKIVISDRMADSSRAYQAFGRGLDDDFIQQVNNWATQHSTPDLTFYLKIDYKMAAFRLRKRNEPITAIEKEQEFFFNRVIEGFETIFKERPSVITIDASLSEKEVHALLIEKTYHYLGL